MLLLLRWSKKIKILNFLHKNRELSIVVIIIMVLGMMIIPLPAYVMDFFIAFNICMTLIILMVVVYIDSPLQLTSFPSILLMLALLRIGITISTSRLILLNGDAGEIINSFGEFVVGGNLIVGVIIFSIITVINFIVITKGSERVAEVSARFSLDALPGKQMSIDSDLKAGSIKIEQANQMRKDLGLESRLFGAMDGAMKFVKGDAIASIIDILINLVGGIIVGIVVNGLAFSKALSTYSLLTVGDGLVQQIPALVVSLTAGMMITRVGDDTDKKSMGENILSQIFANYKPILAASALLLIMSVIPGMPSLVFLVLFVIVVVIGLVMYRITNKKTTPETADGLAIQDDSSTKEAYAGWKLTPLLVLAAENLKGLDIMDNLKTALQVVQQSILFELGVEVPQIIVRFSPKLDKDSFQILVYEIPITTLKILPDKVLLPNPDKNLLEKLGITNYTPNQQSFGQVLNGGWVDSHNVPLLDEYAISYLTVEKFLIQQIKHVISKKVSTFLGIQEVKNVLDKMPEYEDLTRELLRMIPLNKITEILQRLVSEGVSIRNFKLILDTMLEWSQLEKDIVIVTEQVRKALGSYIAYKFSNETNIISCFSLDSQLEDLIRDSIRFNNNGSYLALDEALKLEIIATIEKAYRSTADISLSSPPVILTHLDIRRYVRYIIEAQFGQIPVLSFQELEGHAEFNGLGVIQMDNLSDYE